MRAGNAVPEPAARAHPSTCICATQLARPPVCIRAGQNNQNMFVATYAVKPGDALQEAVPLQLFAGGKYEVDIHGPNGFYRAFRGDSTPSPIVGPLRVFRYGEPSQRQRWKRG